MGRFWSISLKRSLNMEIFWSNVFSVRHLLGNQRPNKYFSNCFANWVRRVFFNELPELLGEVISTF